MTYTAFFSLVVVVELVVALVIALVISHLSSSSSSSSSFLVIGMFVFTVAVGAKCLKQ